jgi:lipopolysaccharide transport system permease protein
MLEYGGYAAASGPARTKGRAFVIASARELVSYRSLVRNLVTKDLKVRYKHSVLGFVWSLLNPLLMMVIYTFVFTKILSTQRPKFEVFIFVALLPWNWCARSLSLAANSLLDNAAIINKVYFPRVLLPVSVVASEAVNFLLALPALFLLMVLFKVEFTAWIAYLPILMALEAALLTGLSLFLAALNVVFRDTGVILEVLLLAWFFLTPIFYDVSDISSALMADWMYRLNPMAAIIGEYRKILYFKQSPYLLGDLRVAATALAVLAVGYLFFTGMNRRLGEHL